MNRALWLLLGLQLRGRLRRLWRAVATVRGALLALFGAGLFALFLWPSFSGEPASAEHLAALRRIGPLALAGFCLMNLLLASGERAITFTPAEVNLLFPGPVSRRELLVYKICTGLGGILLAAVFMTVVTRAHQALLAAAFLGLVLTLMFVQLFTLTVALITCALGEHAYTRRRKLVLLGMLALAAIGLFQIGVDRLRGDPLGLLQEMADAPVVQALLTPFRWLVETLLAERLWPDLVQWGGLSLGLIGLLFLIVLALDAHYLETAASVSERAYARLERLRQGGMAAAAAPSGMPRLGLPTLPFWGGIGPLAWRQLTTVLRSLRSLAVMVLVFVMVVLPYALQEPPEGEHNLIGPLVGTLVGMSFFVSAMIPLDFRSDLDRMELLKTLPVPAWRLAVGQLVTPVLVLSVAQGLVAMAVQLFWQRLEPVLVWTGLLALPINCILLGLENWLFLLYPARLAATTAGDMQLFGRTMLLFFAKLLGLLIALLPGTLVGLLVAFLTENWMVVAAAAWITCFAPAVGMVPLVALAFQRFDVARDVPA